MAKAKHMRLPNGFGSISYLGKNRRNPYLVRKTIGKDEFGKPIMKPIQPQSCFKTYNDAYAALLEYNKCPYTAVMDTTIAEAYEKWSTDYFSRKNLSESRRKQITNAYNSLSSVHERKMISLNTMELESVIARSSKSQHVQGEVRGLLVHLYDWGEKYEVVEKNYARLTATVSRPAATIQRTIFTANEVAALWKDCQSMEYADMVLFGLYSGMRPGEICDIECANINLEEHYLIGGMKTAAGRNRIIPIHDAVYDIVKSRMGDGKLFKSQDGEDVKDRQYKYRFKLVMNHIGATHLPHDTRHAFVTQAKQFGVNDFCLKLIVGHEINDITEKVYTHREPEELLREINKISY